jgi:hypothetical protein
MQKLYCYVDESGQDTKGKFFIVAVVIACDIASRSELEKQLANLEMRVRKKTDWRHTRSQTRVAYFEEVMRLEALKGMIFYSLFRDTQDYDQLTSQSIIKAVQAVTTQTVKVTVSVEGQLNEVKKRRLAKALRAARVRYDTVRGQRFGSSALIRLADACAGFISDWQRGKPYVKEILNHPRFLYFFLELR